MAEMLSSAIVGETMSKIVSNLIGKDEEKYDTSENIERLEMAQIKIEAALQMSNRWQISDMPLVRWRIKLKRAAQDCDDMLRKCKQRALEEEETRQRMSESSFPKRIARATKSLVSSFIPFGNDGSISSSGAVRRFERFAVDANEFLKFVEFGETPRQYMFFNPLVGHLLTGKSLRYQVLQGSKYRYFGIRPMNFAERGVEAMLGFVDIDFKVPTKGFSLSLMLRLSESTDIFGVIIKCMQSVAPHFKSAAEGVKKELIQLPTQDFSCVPYSPYGEGTQYWDNVHNTSTQWFRPNPLCCNEHEHDLSTSSSTCNTIESSPPPSKLLSDIFPEEVIVVHLQCHVSLPNQYKNRQSSATAFELGGRSSFNPDMHPLKLGILFIPHDTPEDIEPSADGYALEVIDEKDQETIHMNACLQDLDEKFLPKAIDYLYKNAESNMYQICLKSRHGTAHLCVENTTTEMQSSRRIKASTHARNRRVIQKQENCRMQEWKKVPRDLLKLWVVRASDKLQGSIRSWTAVRKLA
ncbi:uncharacterized protein LOC133886940 [Phragmites australis]|uniref:uncharacterized protein LOC133886940 n=1 Tax=Phragmites australis TaxID=29695 RepID=UPI002D79F417|nr:uncharacterized protein LOC133886940 [Phragmites australis]